MTTLTKAFEMQAKTMCGLGFEGTTAWDIFHDWRAWLENKQVVHPRFYFSVRTFQSYLHIYGGPNSVDPYA